MTENDLHSSADGGGSTADGDSDRNSAGNGGRNSAGDDGRNSAGDGGRHSAAPRILALCPDMLFASRVGGAARAAGVEARILRDRDSLLRALDEAPGRTLVLVDLTAAPDAADAIAAVKADHPHASVIAFARHDATNAIRAARAAGADRVLARSAFVAQLPDILRGR